MWRTLFLLTAATLSAQRTLDIYWIDAEGGAATLIVTPAGQSLLADTGNPGDRDAQRIYDVATKQAHLKKIDYVLITHFHSDHVGGVPALAKLIPMGEYVDHGDSVETENPADKQRWEAYQDAAKAWDTIAKIPGEKMGTARSVHASQQALLRTE